MKSLKSLFLSSFVICLFLTSCSSDSSKEDTSDMSSAEISELAMNHFLEKVAEGNYTISADDYLITSVYSNDLVTFEYVDDLYDDYTVMSVNKEAFQAVLTEDGLEDVSFVSEGQATEAAKTKLLNYWTDESVSEGNIYNLFYNQQEEPLTFVSYEDTVKQSLMTFAGYSDRALALMEEVYLVMDDVDPTVVHLQAVVNDDLVARIYYDDLDITVTFGDAKDNETAEAWMKNPEYPAARTEWTDTDIFIMNSVFLPEYGENAVPFPSFASYALTIDENRFVQDDAVYIRDGHADEKDMADYAALLKKSGFEEVKETDTDGSEITVYRRMLREAYKCYSSIELEYDNGLNITAKKYYDFPVYDGFEAVNDKITSLGYTKLPDSLNTGNVKGTDTAYELTESWLYFFDYDAVLYVDIDYEDEEAIQAGLKEYEESLLNAGFHEKTSDGEETESLESENEFCTFRYQFTDDHTLSLLFKAEKYIPAAQAEQMVQNAGFPKISLSEPISCRDLTLFEKVQYGLDLKAFLTISQTFASTEEAEAFLDDYEAALTAAGFDRVNPDNVGSLKQIAIYNEDEGMLVGIDFYEQADGVLVNFDFKAE